MARLALFCALFVATLAVTGCGGPEEIAVYRVAKPRAVAAPVATHRLFGAIIPRDKDVWFFKSLESEAALLPHLESLAEFITSVQFSTAGTPTWTLPKDWKQMPAREGRTATLMFGPADAPLELAVSKLPKNSPDDEAILANLNRWRRQLSLNETTDAAKDCKEFKTKDGQRVVIVNLSGRVNEAAMPPIAGRRPATNGPAAGPTAAERAAADVEDATGVKLKYDMPTGWKDQGPRPLVKASFLIENGDQHASIDISSHSAGAESIADPLLNVNRWRGQIGLAPVNADTLAKLVKTIKVAGYDASYVELIGDANVPKPQAVLVAMFTADDQVWFVKWKGDAALVESQRAPMAAFLGSLQLVKE